MTRREAREQAFILVFEQAIREEPMDAILHDAAEARDLVPSAFAEQEALGVEAAFVEGEWDGLLAGLPRWPWPCCAWLFTR